MSLTFFCCAQKFQPRKIGYKWIIILIDHVIYFICSVRDGNVRRGRTMEARRCMTLKLNNFLGPYPGTSS